MMVVLFHFRANSHIENLALVRNSWLFVDFFFVLSGFVIAANYSQKLLGGEVSVFRFMGLRIARLYPLHLFVLALFVLTEGLMLLVRPLLGNADRMPFEGGRALSLLPENILLLQSLGPKFGLSGIQSWNVPAWSISAELWVYLVFALTLLAGFWGTILFRLVAFAVIPVAIIVWHGGSLGLEVDGGVFRCIMGFAVGTLLWQAYRVFGTGQFKTGYWEVPVFAGMLVFVAIAPGYGITLLAPLVFGLVLWVFSAEQGLLSRLFSHRVFLLLGTLSYSIYMVHTYLHARFNNLAVLVEKVSGVSLHANTSDPLFGVTLWAGDLFVLVGSLLTVAFSFMTWKYIEKPGQVLGRRWMGAKPSATVQKDLS